MKKEDLQTSEMQQAFILAQPLQRKYKKYVRTLFGPYKEVISTNLHSKFLACFDGVEASSLAKDFNDVLNTTEAFFSKNGKPIIDLSKNEIHNLPYPEGVNKRLYFFIANKVMNVTMKGIGKGEVLLNFAFGNVTKKSDKHQDNVVLSLNNEEMIVECKNGNATYKANEKSNFRIIDKLLDFLYQGISGEQFRCDDLSKISAYLEELYPDMDSLTKQSIVNFWNDSKNDENKEWFRKVFLASKILEEYKKIDKHDIIIHSRQDTGKQKMQFAVIADNSDLEFLITNFKCKPQLKRGGGTQAVGDGYCDMELILS